MSEQQEQKEKFGNQETLGIWSGCLGSTPAPGVGSVSFPLLGPQRTLHAPPPAPILASGSWCLVPFCLSVQLRPLDFLGQLSTSDMYFLPH